MCPLILAIFLHVPGPGEVELPAGTPVAIVDSGPLVVYGKYEYLIEWEDVDCGNPDGGADGRS
jgi:hypothetical protein